MPFYPENWQELRARALERDSGLCRNCSLPASQVHHIVPLSRGGTNNLSNLVSLCEQCHVNVEPHLANLLSEIQGGKGEIVIIDDCGNVLEELPVNVVPRRYEAESHESSPNQSS